MWSDMVGVWVGGGCGHDVGSNVTFVLWLCGRKCSYVYRSMSHIDASFKSICVYCVIIWVWNLLCHHLNMCQHPLNPNPYIHLLKGKGRLQNHWLQPEYIFSGLLQQITRYVSILNAAAFWPYCTHSAGYVSGTLHSNIWRNQMPAVSLPFGCSQYLGMLTP